MKPSLISTSLLLLCLLLVSESQGIRMDKGFMPEGRNEFQKGENSLTKRSNNEGGLGAILCKDENCSGNKRKNISVTPSTISTTIYKKKKNAKHRADTNSNGEKSNYKQGGGVLNVFYSDRITNNNYSDLVDIVEMDYSPARRKPPIHN